MSCGCSSTPCGCNTPNIPRGPRGFAGPAGPAPNITITDVSEGPAAAEITGTSPNLFLALTIPPGATGPAGAPGTNGTNGTNGQNGWGTSFDLLDSFSMPAPGGATGILTIGDNRMLDVGTWVKITGFSIEGNWFVVIATPGDDQVQLRNPGSADLAPYWGVSATSIPSNAPTGTVFNAGETGVVVGAPGLIGPVGPAGPAGTVQVVNAIPLLPPAPGGEFVIYTDNALAPTVVTGYSWNGSIWSPTANLTPVAGSQIYSVTGVPAGAFGKNGDWAFNTVTLDVYYKTAGTWTNPFDLSATFTQVASASSNYMGTAPLYTDGIVGFDPLASTFTAPQLPYTIDLAIQGHSISIDKNITFDFSDASFSHSGVWEVQVENTDIGSAIDIDITAGRFAENATLALAFPISLAVGDTRMFVFRKNKAGNRLIIENTYLVNNL